MDMWATHKQVLLPALHVIHLLDVQETHDAKLS